ncbi:16S rRNA (adenine(1518)-N(6)/adenine(1519)-N(6))-dimethyltransferase RsmA [Patescibacteria group bacterium]
MDLFSKKDIENLLSQHQIFPKKKLGQNFLIDEKILEKIITASDLKSKDVVLEIGPGTGSLTKELAQTAKKIIAVEKDPKMTEIAKETTKNLPNITIIQGDALKTRVKLGKEYKVIANLPYYIGSQVIRMFLEKDVQPKLMVIMVQKEVAERICAKPPDMTILSVSVQFYSTPEIISLVPKSSFWPQPEVQGGILRLKEMKKQSGIDRKIFFKIVKAGFSQPRKKVINNLSKRLRIDKKKISSWLLENKINPNQRAETLEIKDWINLTKTFNS